MKRKGDNKQPNHDQEKRKFKAISVVGDQKLIPRVEEYLERNSHRPMITVSSIADHLQSTYREYQRKKKNTFRISVEKAYEIVCHQRDNSEETYSKTELIHLQKKQKSTTIELSSDSDDCSTFSEENSDYVTYKDTNAMNSFLSNMYRKNVTKDIPHSLADTTSTPGSLRPQSTSNNSTPVRIDSPVSLAASDTNPPELFHIDRKGDRSLNGQTSSLNDSVKSVASADVPLSKKLQNKTDPTHSADRSRPSTPAKQSQKHRAETSITKDTNTPKKKKIKENKDKSADSDKLLHNKKGIQPQQSTVKFADIGGSEATLKEVCKLLVHLKHPEVYQQLGVTPPRGFLLHGPPGCGKTLLAHAIAGELEMPFIKLAATEIVSGVSGESEEKVRDLFDQAVATAPCVLFIDEIDAITPKRETASKDMERRIVSQLLTCMDDLNSRPVCPVLVIGATNRPDSLDPALRRAGRFDREIGLGIPDEESRGRILEVLCRGLRLSPDFNFARLAHLSPGYVGADLSALVREAAMSAVDRTVAEIQVCPACQKQSGQSQTKSDKISSGETDVPSNAAEDSMSDEPETVQKQSDNLLEATSAADEKPFQTNVVIEHTCSLRKTILRVVDIDTENPSNVDSALCVFKSDSPMTSNTNTISVTSKPPELDYLTVLSWLQNRPPLSEKQLSTLFITISDFEMALQQVQPSAQREGFATVPGVTWDDIGALKDVRDELQMAILAPVQHPEVFKQLGLSTPPGVLLAGPPGCGKTLLAKAVANESGINFISVKGPELLNMYVGESERAVRQVFQRARNSAPCVIFFDELDALCPRRSGSAEGGSTVRVVNQLLTEMDGLETRRQVFIMGATNRPDIIDPAVLRPGRLDKILYVGLPDEKDRLDILRTITKNGTKPRLSAELDLEQIARDSRCQGFTGADLAALVREAAVTALRHHMGASSCIGTAIEVSFANFDVAFGKVKPSVSAKDHTVYESMRGRLKGP